MCVTALTRGHYFDKHDKSRHYLTLVTANRKVEGNFISPNRAGFPTLEH